MQHSNHNSASGHSKKSSTAQSPVIQPSRASHSPGVQSQGVNSPQMHYSPQFNPQKYNSSTSNLQQQIHHQQQQQAAYVLGFGGNVSKSGTAMHLHHHAPLTNTTSSHHQLVNSNNNNNQDDQYHLNHHSSSHQLYQNAPTFAANNNNVILHNQQQQQKMMNNTNSTQRRKSTQGDDGGNHKTSQGPGGPGASLRGTSGGSNNGVNSVRVSTASLSTSQHQVSQQIVDTQTSQANNSSGVQKMRGSANFFKELTNSLYDGKMQQHPTNYNQGNDQGSSSHSRQAVSNQGTSSAAAFLINQSTTGLAAAQSQQSIFIPTNSTIKQGANVQKVLGFSSNHLSPKNPGDSSQKVVTLKKKFTSSGMQSMHQGTTNPSLSNQSSSCNVSISQSSKEQKGGSNMSVPVSYTVGTTRKNSKDPNNNGQHSGTRIQGQGHKAQSSPLTIIQQHQAANHSRQQTINNVPATLSPKEISNKVASQNSGIHKLTSKSPQTQPNSLAASLQNQNPGVISRQAQHSPMISQNTSKKSNNQQSSQIAMNFGIQPPSSLLQAAGAKNSQQIFQKVQDLKKKYAQYENIGALPQNVHIQNVVQNTHQSAPSSKVTSPDTRNYAVYNGEIILTNAGSNVGGVKTQHLNQYFSNASPGFKNIKQPLQNNFIIGQGNNHDTSIYQGDQPHPRSANQNDRYFSNHQQLKNSINQVESRPLNQPKYHPSPESRDLNNLQGSAKLNSVKPQSINQQTPLQQSHHHSSKSLSPHLVHQILQQQQQQQQQQQSSNHHTASSAAGIHHAAYTSPHIGSHKSNQCAPISSKGINRNTKDLIISHIGKYIKKKQQNNSPNPRGEVDEQVNEEILQNLREFLCYLEEKNIINTERLENNKEEMNNLIKDLMKLDLAKFSKPRSQSGQRRGQSGSPGQNTNEQTNINDLQNVKSSHKNAFTQRQNSQPNNASQANFLFSPQTSSQKQFNDAQSKGETFAQRMQQQIGQHDLQSRQVPTIQLMINTNVNNFCITPATAGSIQGQTIQNTKNINTITNNYNIYPGNPTASSFISSNQMPTQPNEPTVQVPKQQPNNLSTRRNSEQVSTSQQFQKIIQPSSSKTRLQQQQPLQSPQQIQNVNGAGGFMQNLQKVISQPSTHKRNASDNTTIQKRSLNVSHNQAQNPVQPSLKVISSQAESKKQSNAAQSTQLSAAPSHRKNLPSTSDLFQLQQHLLQQQIPTNIKSQSTQFAVQQSQQPAAIQQNQPRQNQVSRSPPSHAQQVQPQPLIQSEITNQEQTANTNKVTLNEDILSEREKIIKFIKAYIKKNNEIPPTTLDYYKFVKLIGKGAFGKVTLGIHKLTGKYVAIKTIDKSYMKDEYSKRKVFQEVYILKKIRHSCVIRLLEVFESPKHFLMVMEYAGGGDLLQYVKQRKRLDEDTTRAIFKQIVYGLGHCHCRSVLHRDIKLDNVLMDGEGGVKLCDFGVSRLVKKHQIIKEQCGTPAYLAPEIIIDEGYEGFYADIWSLGVLLYAMLQGTVPFKANNIADLHKLILKGDFDFPYPAISEEAKDLVKKMLLLTPEKRISIPEMLNHPWLQDYQQNSAQDDDDEHDLRVGATFFRQECMDGLIGKGGQMESGNINFINVENLYYYSTNEKDDSKKRQARVKYSDYCALTEDFMTYRIDEEALGIVESYGYSRKMIIDSINKGDINHATASYYLLIHSTTQ